MDDIRDLLPFYALDALTPEETTAVETWLAQNPAARQEITAWRDSAGELAQTTTPVQPPPQIKSDLMARIEASVESKTQSTAAQATQSRPQARTQSVRHPSWWERLRGTLFFPAFATGALVAAMFAVIWGVSLTGQIDTKNETIAALESEVVEIERTAASLQNEATILQETVAEITADNELLTAVNNDLLAQIREQEQLIAQHIDLTSPDLQVVNVNGTEANLAADAHILFEPSTETAILLVSNLAVLPSDQTYQFWLIGDEGAVSAGIFETDDTGTGGHPFSATTLPDNAAVGVSIEPANGSNQPTGDIVLLGNL